jgi:hypothetical protein
MSITPSDEQSQIIKLIGEGHNVLGDCVAGSGKTTSVLLIAQAFPDKRILQVTYNAQLKLEVRKKAVELGVNNLEIHTYNSLCVKYYHRQGYMNDKLRLAIDRNLTPLSPISINHIIVIDETQDMNMLFYRLIKKFIQDSPNKNPQMLILGDKYQSVYKFIGADSRFLTLSPSIWTRPFLPSTLTTSYRITDQIGAFVNEVMLGYNRIQTIRSGPNVLYKVCKTFEIHKSICEMLLIGLKDGSVKPDDIFVLAGSIKGAKTPIRLLENSLASNGIPCYYPTSDDKTLDEEVIEGKVVFSTFHQAKGRERKIVIIYGFDESYFKYYCSGENPSVCPPTLYVAATRAKERLILLHDEKQGPLPFLTKSINEISELSYVQFEGFRNPETPSVLEVISGNERHNTTPTELVKFITETNMKLLSTIADELFETEEAASYMVQIPSKISFDNGIVEDVSEINGIAIPTMHESVRRDESHVEVWTRQEYTNLSLSGSHPFLTAAYRKIEKGVKTPLGFTRLVIMYISLVEQLYHKINQITHQKWLTNAMVDGCFKVLDKHVSEKAKYEQEIECETSAFPEFGKLMIKGRIDAYDEDVVLELKCVDSFTIEHKLQLLIYAWMWQNTNMTSCGPRVFKIVNMRTGEVLRLNASSHLVDEAMKILVHNKYSKLPEVSDSEFIDSCISNKFISAAASVAAVPLFIDE